MFHENHPNSMFQTFIVLIFSTQAFLSEFNNGRLVYYLALVGLFLWYIMCISFTLAIMNPTLLKWDFDNYCFYILPHVLQRIFLFPQSQLLYMTSTLL